MAEVGEYVQAIYAFAGDTASDLGLEVGDDHAKKADKSRANSDANKSHLDHFRITEVSKDQLARSVS